MLAACGQWCCGVRRFFSVQMSAYDTNILCPVEGRQPFEAGNRSRRGGSSQNQGKWSTG